MRWQHFVGVGFVVPVLLTGCATSGSDLMSYTVNTNRRVASLEQNLTPTIKKLDESVTDVSTRLNSIDEATRKNGADLETTQNQLQRLEQRFDELQRNTYREKGLSVPKAPAPGTSTSIQVGPVVEQPLSGEAAAAPAPAGPPPPPPPPPSAEDKTLAEVVGPSAPAGPPPDAVPPPPPAPAPRARVETIEAPAAAPDVNVYQQATEMYQKQEYGKAANLYDAYLKQNPSPESSGNARFWKGESLLKMNKYREAVQEFEKVRKDNPTHTKMPYVLHQEAKALLGLGKQKEAMDLLHELIREYPASKPAQSAKQDLKAYNLQ